MNASEHERPVFLIGSQRSGTTLLRAILLQSEIHIPRETKFLPDLWQRRADYGDFSTARGRWYFIRDLVRTAATTRTAAFDAFDLTPGEAEEAIDRASPTDYAGACRALYRRSARKAGKPRWGDKTPDYTLHIEWLGEVFPDLRCVHIVRDPRDVARSMIKVGWSKSYRAAAEHWLHRVSAGVQQGGALGADRYREIRYEDLVHRPEAELRPLCEWLGLPFSSRMLEFHTRSGAITDPRNADHHRNLSVPLDPSRAQAWRRDLDERDIADVEALCGPLAESLGYELTGARQSVPRMAAYRLGELLAPRVNRWKNWILVAAGRV